MSLALCLFGWGVAGMLACALLRQRQRRELTARACHELRGSATAIGLAAAALRREPGGLRRALPFEAQLDRLRAGLGDLEAARAGRRADAAPTEVSLEWMLRGAAAGWLPAARADGRGLTVRSRLGKTVVRADPGRLAQVLGNLLANAVEHGSGTVELLGRRSGDRVVVEVRDQGVRNRARREPGTGLRPRAGTGDGRAPGASRGRGLGIAAEAVEEAGGKLTLHCREGATVAAVELPVAER